MIILHTRLDDVSRAFKDLIKLLHRTLFRQAHVVHHAGHGARDKGPVAGAEEVQLILRREERFADVPHDVLDELDDGVAEGDGFVGETAGGGVVLLCLEDWFAVCGGGLAVVDEAVDALDVGAVGLFRQWL